MDSSAGQEFNRKRAMQAVSEHSPKEVISCTPGAEQVPKFAPLTYNSTGTPH